MRAGSELGFVWPAALAALALASLALSVAGPLWAQQEQRAREQELLRVGVLYARALASYRDATPGGARILPTKLEQLLLDGRFVGVQRHLRSLYPDPIDTRLQWGVLRDEQGRITAVFSQSDKHPVARGPVLLFDRTLPPATTYRDWKFAALGSP